MAKAKSVIARFNMEKFNLIANQNNATDREMQGVFSSKS
jgi:hypothetical protein